MTREEAIGRIIEHQAIHSRKEPFTPYLDEAFRMAIEALKEERPHGEWIYHRHNHNYECPFCHRCIDETDMPCADTWDFCPNCGARMKEGDEK